MVTLPLLTRTRLAGVGALIVLVPMVAVGPAPAYARSAHVRSSGHQAEPPPQPEPQDAAVEGIVTLEDGSPAAGVDVTVVGHDDAGFAGIVAFVFTLGLACIFDSYTCTGSSTEGSGGTTGADGGYRSTLPGSYVPGTETDTDWVVTASLPATGGQDAGPKSSFEFEVNIDLQAAPPLPLWPRTPTVSVEGWQATVSVDGAPPKGTARPMASVRGPGVGPLAASGTQATFDLRRLESTDEAVQPLVADVTSYADVRVPHAAGRTIYHQRVSTATVALPPIDLVPPSRGAPCTLSGADGAPLADAGTGCPLTDGERSSSIPPGATSATVELSAAVEVADVFVTGFQHGGTVEVSDDGTTWSPLGNAGPNHDVFGATSASPPARFVRLTRAEGLDGVTEVSVWPGQKAPAPAPTPAPTSAPASAPPVEPTSPPSTSASRPSGPPDDGGQDGEQAQAPGTAAGPRTPWAAAVAVVALVGASVAVGLVRARRPA